jgi:GWxTD domain-containing protein
MKMKLRNCFYIPVLLVFTAFSSCRAPKQISTQNVAFLYDYEENLPMPDFLVFHTNDSVTNIYYSLYPKELTFSRKNPDSAFQAQGSIQYLLFESYKSKNILDSGAISFIDREHYKTNSHITGDISIHAQFPGKYILQLTFTDRTSQKASKTILEIDKESLYSRQNFFIKSPGNDFIFQNYFTGNQSIILTTARKEVKKLYVRYYDRKFPLPSPPFIDVKPKVFEYAADSTFEIEMHGGLSDTLALPAQGFYHFQPDTGSKTGFTLFRFISYYPAIGTPEQMLLPLRYLSTKNEFEKMFLMRDKKTAVDNFWLSSAGNPELAKELIKNFYNRVQDANRLFLSYTEGWKTDRGLIYIIYGPPNIVYKKRNEETWVYGEIGNIMSLTLTFYKVENPFSDNDFILSRSPAYKESWYNAVETWRR